MNDVAKPCANCGHDHKYGILRYSPDGVPLYGARICDAVIGPGDAVLGEDLCTCDRFVERNEGLDIYNRALTQTDVKELWAATSFLSAQVPMATRIVVRQITALLGAEGALPAPLGAAVSEFMGLMISQITDIRGAMTRDENKFAHLVSHTDEIVESMKGVVQLSERLNTIYGAISQIQQQQAKTEHDIAGIAAVLKTLAPDTVEILAHPTEGTTDFADEEAYRMFRDKMGTLMQEPIVTDSEPADD